MMEYLPELVDMAKTLFSASIILAAVTVGFIMGRKSRSPAPTQLEILQDKAVQGPKKDDSNPLDTPDMFDEAYIDGPEPSSERKSTL